MASYNDFKKKAKDALDTLADVSAEAYKIAEEKARVLARKAKLNTGIANEKATIRRLNVEIGATYYKMNKDNPDDAYKRPVEEITAAYERIAVKQAELDDLKSPNKNCDGSCEKGSCTDENCNNENQEDHN
ncbi:MAG: hypothetical protein FWB97_06145 [Oscillospiraceae bacterium]|nr:hypothetical protein [Oscillospiraceae bacterium]